MKETDLALAVIAWFKEEGWEVYQEVEYEGRIADIVATRGPSDSWIVEVKAKRGLRVLDQAIAWLGEASRVSVAVPKLLERGESSTAWHAAIHACGLGEFTIDRHGTVELRRSPLILYGRPITSGPGIRTVLREEHKHFAQAGNSDGERWSPFREMARRLLAAVGKHPGLKLRDFVEQEPHVYSTDDQAVAVLRRVIKTGGIKGIEVRHGGKCYPEGYNRHVARSKP